MCVRLYTYYVCPAGENFHRFSVIFQDEYFDKVTDALNPQIELLFGTNNAQNENVECKPGKHILTWVTFLYNYSSFKLIG